MCKFFAMKNVKSPSALKALAGAKCPQCRTGNMFVYPWWQVPKFSKFYQNCPTCQLRFDREPGFFHGAMYISYALIVAMVTNASLILYILFNNPPFEVYIYTIVLLNILLFPLLFRYSRVIYLYLFGGVKFDSSLPKKK